MLQISLGAILFTHLEFEFTYPVRATKFVLSGLPEFNVTERIGNGAANDYLRRIAMQKFPIAPIATYRLSFPCGKAEVTEHCDENSCYAVRIHDNIERLIVLPDHWTRGQAIPKVPPNWKSDFDPTYRQWTNLQVHNASTLQMEISFPQATAADLFFKGECQVYGYPYLALRICLQHGSSSNELIAGTPFKRLHSQKLRPSVGGSMKTIV